MMRLSKWGLTAIIIVPTALFTLISTGMATLQLKRDAAVTAEILISQIDHVTSIARHATHITAGMADQPCETIIEKITATGALTPYIRSTGLIKDNLLVCSSVTGAREQNASVVYGTHIYAGTDSLRIIAITGTTSVPGQTAIIYAANTRNHMTAFSLVDARYFTDLMDSLDDENHSALQLRFSDGPVISGREKISQRGLAFSAVFHSDFSQAHLEVQTPLVSLWRYLLRYMIFMGPLSLLLTLAALYLWQRWRSIKMSLADEIRKGIAEGEFSVHYQPVCETVSGRCSGAEALMRWQRGDGRTISPAVFILAAEEQGVIVSLTQHLFSLIAKDVRDWEITSPFKLGVNIAADHLTDKTFATDVLQLQAQIHDFQLVLEITERSLVEDVDKASTTLNALRQHGCQVAVDDFGTGYCSLALLQSLPVDYLKIDKNFIDALTSAEADTPILDTIIDLSKRLGLATIAEGVSSAHQVDYLIENEVPYIQGFLYARPMTASSFYQWYRETSVQWSENSR